VEGEALLTRLPVVEAGNLDFRARDMVALVARVTAGGRPVDMCVTHLYMSRGDDSLRLFQVQQLLTWIESRDGVEMRIVCGDFNAPMDAPSATLMATRFRPTQTAPTAFTPLADTDGTVSHPYWSRMDRCIDFIWVAGPIQIVASEVCFSIVPSRLTPPSTRRTTRAYGPTCAWVDESTRKERTDYAARHDRLFQPLLSQEHGDGKDSGLLRRARFQRHGAEHQHAEL